MIVIFQSKENSLGGGIFKMQIREDWRIRGVEDCRVRLPDDYRIGKLESWGEKR